jgi:hypothetical protein
MQANRSWLQFGLRDAFWAVLVCALLLTWWLDRRRAAPAPVKVPALAPGRFQFQELDSNYDALFDTATGQYWMKRGSEPWYEVSPPPEPSAK